VGGLRAGLLALLVSVGIMVSLIAVLGLTPQVPAVSPINQAMALLVFISMVAGVAWIVRRNFDQVLDRLQAEQNAREQAHEVLRSVVEALDTSPVGMVLYDPHGRLVFANRRFKELCGPVAQVLVAGVTYERFCREYWRTVRAQAQARDADARPEWLPQGGQVWALDEDSFVADRLARHAQAEPPDYEFELGPAKWILVSERRLPNGFVIGFRVDISRLKQAEQALRDQQEHLSELVSERTRELEQALEATRDAARAKAEFLTNMSHELRTPLHAILSFAGMGRDRAETGPPEKLLRYFDQISAGANRLLGLVNNLLDAGKIEAGYMTLEFRPMDLRAVLEPCIQQLAGLAEVKGLKLWLDTHYESLNMVGDPDRLQQVFHNLIGNAIKFSPVRGEIRVLVRPADGGWHIEVLDQGPGIPVEELASVFQQFVQSSKTKTGAGGTGLGLAISRALVRAHGGDIRAENREEGGARFVVELPEDARLASRSERSQT
jgi:signal transduction histidine kinase